MTDQLKAEWAAMSRWRKIREVVEFSVIIVCGIFIWQIM